MITQVTVFAESGLRHIKSKSPNTPTAVTSDGKALVSNFLSWFCALPHPHKVFIGGNHDWVLQALGKDEVQEMIHTHLNSMSTSSTTSSTTPSSYLSVAYLDHEEATVGPVKVFGSPYAYWGGHNDAFMNKNAGKTKNTREFRGKLTTLLPLTPFDIFAPPYLFTL